MDAFFTLFDLIGVLARRRYQTAEQCFAPLGLNHTEARLLSLLCQAGGTAPQDTLTKSLTIDRTNAGRGLKRLEQEGHIVRQSSNDDKRANHVKITAKGRKLVSEIAKRRKVLAQTFFGKLQEKEAREVVALLGKSLTAEELQLMQSRQQGER